MTRRGIGHAIGVAMTVLLLGTCVIVLVQLGPALEGVAEPPGRPACSAAEESFAVRLGGDPMLTEGPVGLVRAYSGYAQPCVSLSDSDWYGGAQSAWRSPSDAMPPDDQIVSFYEELAQLHGWQLKPGYSQTWVKSKEGRTLQFSLTLGDLYDGEPAYWARIAYGGILAST